MSQLSEKEFNNVSMIFEAFEEKYNGDANQMMDSFGKQVFEQWHQKFKEYGENWYCSGKMLYQIKRIGLEEFGIEPHDEDDPMDNI